MEVFKELIDGAAGLHSLIEFVGIREEIAFQPAGFPGFHALQETVAVIIVGGGLVEILRDVLETLKPFEEKFKKKIPVIAGGGVFTGMDIANILYAGASGVQMATRFVATHECDASGEFKQAYIDAKEEDVEIIQSPVGMIGRAIRNDFLDEVKAGSKKPIRCLCNCLKPCDPLKAPYCIADALINAQKGNLKNGFAFVGANVFRIKKMVSVKELMEELVSEAEKYFNP